jgi:hypothetical protein
MQRQCRKIRGQRPHTPQRPKGPETGRANPGTNGLSELDGKTGSEGLGGGHDRDRTCDPYHVKVALPLRLVFFDQKTIIFSCELHPVLAGHRR